MREFITLGQSNVNTATNPISFFIGPFKCQTKKFLQEGFALSLEDKIPGNCSTLLQALEHGFPAKKWW
jgi:hypothetical protein